MEDSQKEVEKEQEGEEETPENDENLEKEEDEEIDPEEAEKEEQALEKQEDEPIKEEESKYQQELNKANKKDSYFPRKKSIQVTATDKVTRSDFLSKLEVFDIKDQSNPHNQKYMPFDGFKGPACKTIIN